MTPKQPNIFATETGTTHSGPWDYTQEVPMVFYGPGVVARNGMIEPDRETTLADIAPTLAEMLDTPFPDDRAGRAVPEALVEGAAPPKLVVVVVLDGGGWNVLNRWPKAWPFLASMMKEGTTIRNAVVGSSPSVTPAVHATIGTGTFPQQHGLVDIWLRRGDVTRDSWSNANPRNLRIPTLADLYDRAMGNEPKVGLLAAEAWHLGMMGHGSGIEGGDKDIAVLEDDFGRPVSNTDFYSLPRYVGKVPGEDADIATVDASDGEVDNRWMDHNVLAQPDDRRRSPVRTLYQTRQLKALIEKGGFGADSVPDLLFTNYKQVDLIGHSFNMVNPEMRSILQFTDSALRDLAGFLDDRVGQKNWAMVMTADHGQGPSPSSTGGWPIDVLKLKSFVAQALGRGEHRLFDKWRPTGYWLEPGLFHRDQKAEDISDAITGYRAVDAGGEIPDSYEGRPRDRLFESAFPMAETDTVIECASRR